MFSRKLLTWWAGLLALASGLGTCVSAVQCIGAPLAAPHPTVVLLAGRLEGIDDVVKAKQVVPVKAYTNGPTAECKLELVFLPDPNYPGQSPDYYSFTPVELHDDGQRGDAIARDGKWYGEWQVGIHPPPPYRCQPTITAWFQADRSHEYEPQRVYLSRVAVQPEGYTEPPDQAPDSALAVKAEEGR